VSRSSQSSEIQETAGFLSGLVKQSRLAWRLLNDGRVPGWVKMVPVLAILYFLSPIDLIPDWALPGLGEIDDIVILLLGLKMFVDLSPDGIVREHLDDLFSRHNKTRPTDEPTTDSYIDAPYRILDESAAEHKAPPIREE